MAKPQAVWGIEIGQSALKALRCRRHEATGKIEADAFDFIEYGSILSEPGADPQALIAEALQKFLSRNSVKGDKVAMSVPGSASLARFIKLPPIEAKKIPDIVRYEAKQQIPFPLEDVIFDYQQLAGGVQEQGIYLETEVGLFAMKKDQVQAALEPFNKARIEVDIIQIAPIALYNYMSFDKLASNFDGVYDPDNPPEEIAILSLGCETSDLVITNGFRVWLRSIPVGGNHFTKALMKQLDLSFAKAEHLKRNAAQSGDPKAVFQAMRPVFTELASEVQKSLYFYLNNHKSSTIKQIIAMGNAMKLPGIRTFLARHFEEFGYDVGKLDSFSNLMGPLVVESPQFKENIQTYGACYGLAVQGLQQGKLATNLLPKEIALERMIRAKQPWALAACAAVLVGLMISSIGFWRAYEAVAPKYFSTAESQADAEVRLASQKKTDFKQNSDYLVSNQVVGSRLIKNLERRWYWIELLKAVNLCLPQNAATPEQISQYFAAQAPADPSAPPATVPPVDPANPPAATPAVPAGNVPAVATTPAPPAGAPAGKSWWDDIQNRDEIHLRRIEVEEVPDLANWWARLKSTERKVAQGAGGADPYSGGAPASGPPSPDASGQPDGSGQPGAEGAPQPDPGPSGSGWVVQISGHHFHNPVHDPANQGLEFLKKTLLANLNAPTIRYFDEQNKLKEYSVADLGISHAVVLRPENILWEFDPIRMTNYEPPDWNIQSSGGMSGGSPGGFPGAYPGPRGMGGFPGGGEGGIRPPMSGGIYPPPQPGGVRPPMGIPGMMEDPMKPGPVRPLPKEELDKKVKLPRFDFRIQFAFQELSHAERVERAARRRAEEAQKAAAEEERLRQLQAAGGAAPVP